MDRGGMKRVKWEMGGRSPRFKAESHSAGLLIDAPSGTSSCSRSGSRARTQDPKTGQDGTGLARRDAGRQTQSETPEAQRPRDPAGRRAGAWMAETGTRMKSNSPGCVSLFAAGCRMAGPVQLVMQIGWCERGEVRYGMYRYRRYRRSQYIALPGTGVSPVLMLGSGGLVVVLVMVGVCGRGGGWCKWLGVVGETVGGGTQRGTTHTQRAAHKLSRSPSLAVRRPRREPPRETRYRLGDGQMGRWDGGSCSQVSLLVACPS
jgi:hypothetical protein